MDAAAIPPAKAIFAGTLVADSFTAALRVLLLLFALLFTTFTQIAGAYDEDDMTEFFVLMLGALVGMCLMISANHILIVMLGVEMASVPCYVLAGMKRNQPKSQRGRPEICRFRRRHGGSDALRNEPAGRRARLGARADDDRSTGRTVSTAQRDRGRPDDGARPRRPDAVSGRWRSSSRPCPSISGRRTCSKAPRPKWPRFSRSPRRPPPSGCWCGWRPASRFPRAFPFPKSWGHAKSRRQSRPWRRRDITSSR